MFIFIVTILLAGCGTAGDVEKDWQNSPADTAAQTPKTTFETRTDTVTTVGTQQQPKPSAQYNSAPVRFMVQIGSFKKVRFASVAQTLARERYKLPVVNDYNAARRRYQIRIGFFETEHDAKEFLLKLRTDYPQEYKNAWVILLGK